MIENRAKLDEFSDKLNKFDTQFYQGAPEINLNNWKQAEIKEVVSKPSQ